MQRIFLLALSVLLNGVLFAQIDGDNLFQNDQVVTIELTFHQTGYWDSLETNYTTSDYMKADLTITDSTGTTSFADVGVRFKGNSTYNHPNDKKPFKIDFNKYVAGQDYDGIKKLNLSNGFKDPSMMREKVFFDFCREAGVLAPRANFANLYINGTLWGFYTMVEQIDDQFLDWAILDDDGNLFKAGDNFGGGPGGGGTPADLVYYGPASTDYTDRYELKTNEVANDWTDFIELMDYINNSTDTDFANEFSTRFEKEELIAGFAIDNLFSNLDSYTGSARNYYFYHNMFSDKWEWVKWDANEAFGSYTNGQNTLTLAVDYYNSDRPLLERIFANTQFYADYENAMCYLIENYFNNAHLDPIIDALYNLIKNDVYADNNKMYSNAQFDQSISTDITSGGGPGGGTIYGLKSFISSRSTSVSSQINCSAYADLDELTNSDWNLFPNPATSSITIDLPSNLEVNGSVSIFALSGRLVYNSEIDSGNTQKIDISNLNSGMYIVRLQTENSTLEKKLIVK